MMIALKYVGLVAWTVVSLGLIGSLWTKHRRDRMAKKLFWTVVLCVPVVGWIFYGGMYKPPERDLHVSIESGDSGWYGP